MVKQDIGLIGLAVMGENLVLNIERNGFSVAVFNRTTAKTEAFIKGKARGKNIAGAKTIEEFVQMLERPRRIILMVQAGAPVDSMIEQLLPYVEQGDIIMDGGNSFFQDTERRNKMLTEKGILYLGTGISGGESGALNGPSIMPGGPREAYDRMAPILNKIAAQVDDGPCCTYIGPGGAGHYVKMVHNGIEYGDMQLIAEAYDILSRALGKDARQIGKIFGKWNQGDLSSYLMEISTAILGVKDKATGKAMVDMILDEAKQKGTGKWTSQNALDIGAPTQTINAAVESRIISALKSERVEAAKVLRGPEGIKIRGKSKLVESVRQALYSAKILSYAQGMALLRIASDEYGFNLNLAEAARIWKGGCIIRAQLLDRIRAAFAANSKLPNLLMDAHFGNVVMECQEGLRHTIQTAVSMGIPCLAMSASLAYYDAYRADRLPANLTQAQRDYFGAHTYRRLDREGSFHTEWEKRGTPEHAA
jgi:6-phosphogluconate dehydrogenase